jgi:hypothetical protein
VRKEVGPEVAGWYRLEYFEVEWCVRVASRTSFGRNARGE